jgi:hypothetical protein
MLASSLGVRKTAPDWLPEQQEPDTDELSSVVDLEVTATAVSSSAQATARQISLMMRFTFESHE